MKLSRGDGNHTWSIFCWKPAINGTKIRIFLPIHTSLEVFHNSASSVMVLNWLAAWLTVSKSREYQDALSFQCILSGTKGLLWELVTQHLSVPCFITHYGLDAIYFLCRQLSTWCKRVFFDRFGSFLLAEKLISSFVIVKCFSWSITTCLYDS